MRWTLVVVMLSLLIGPGCGQTAGSVPPARGDRAAPSASAAGANAGVAHTGRAAGSGPEAGAAAPTAAPPATTALAIGIPNFDASIWDLQVALQQGLFAREGLTVDLISGNMPSLIQALVGGSTQLALVSSDVGILAIDKGANLVYVSQPHRSDVFTFMSVPGARSYADLRGKEIATNSLKGGSASLLRELLLQHGVRPDEYSFVPLGGTPERIAAMKAGQVVATGVSQPRDFQLAAEGFNVLGSTTELTPNWAGSSTLVERRWADEHATTLDRFLRVQVAATTWLRDRANGDAAAALLADYMKQDSKYARALIDQYQTEPQWFLPEARLQPATFEPVIRDLVAIGDLPAEKPTSTYLEPGHLERALAR
jgi:ABC-type nitrate/sulfonate/bicarbonate transport system substrate-binding protein